MIESALKKLRVVDSTIAEPAVSVTMALEALPAEIKTAILLRIPDLQTLSAFIHASPIYYQVYALRRCQILSEVLARDIRPGLAVEAIAVFESRRLLRNDTPLSATELRRIHRALYRFQLCCMLSNEGPPDYKSSWEFDDVEKSHKSLSIFPAWRVEEIGCIYDYMISKYTSLFKDIEADLSKTSPRFADEVQREPVTPCGCYDVSPEGLYTDDYKEQLVFLGLPFLYRLLCISSHEQRSDVISDHISTGAPFLASALTELSYQSTFHRGDDYDGRQSGEELTFINDREGPNLAWTWAIDNKVRADYYNSFASDWRAWAYVMWDRERLESSEASKVGDLKELRRKLKRP